MRHKGLRRVAGAIQGFEEPRFLAGRADTLHPERREL